MEACFISCWARQVECYTKHAIRQKREANVKWWEKENKYLKRLVSRSDPRSSFSHSVQTTTFETVTGCVFATFSPSEDTGQSTAGFWGQSIPQSQTASRRSLHLTHRSSCSWRRSTQPGGEDSDTVTVWVTREQQQPWYTWSGRLLLPCGSWSYWSAPSTRWSAGQTLPRWSAPLLRSLLREHRSDRPAPPRRSSDEPVHISG